MNFLCFVKSHYFLQTIHSPKKVIESQEINNLLSDPNSKSSYSNNSHVNNDNHLLRKNTTSWTKHTDLITTPSNHIPMFDDTIQYNGNSSEEQNEENKDLSSTYITLYCYSLN